MHLIAIPFAILATTVLVSPIWAAGPVDLAPFYSVGLEGSGSVTIRHGATQQVIIREGSAAISEFRIVDNRSLQIRTCRDNCPDGYRLVVDIIMPRLDDLAISGSGTMSVGSGFAAGGKRAVAISGSGVIEAPSLAASTVTAAINGSGRVRVGSARHLQGAINGSGRIGYAGDPMVQVAISGSGTVQRDR